MLARFAIVVLFCNACAPSSDRDVKSRRPPTATVGTVATSVPSVPRPAPSPSPSATTSPVASRVTVGRGSYRSKPCDSRTYERVVVIGADQRVTVEDRVSPCPPGKPCVWSGIVVRKGTYRVEGPESLGRPFRLTLQLGDASPKGGVAPPDHFEWYESRGTLTEPGDTCAYRQ